MAALADLGFASRPETLPDLRQHGHLRELVLAERHVSNLWRGLCS
jgi:hypothetical protein